MFFTLHHVRRDNELFSPCLRQVVVRFHKPIQAWEIESRDGLARRLRKVRQMFLLAEFPSESIWLW